MHDVIIIGAGPAGLSAAVWCDELGLDTLVLEREPEVGGQLLRIHNRIENYLGVEASNGRELRDLFAAQAEAREFDLWTQAEIEEIDLRAKRVRLRSGEELQSIAIIIATGVRRRRLGVPGASEFEGRGVIESAHLGREVFAGLDVCVVGCDDAAADGALLLAEVCPTVTLVHGGRRLSARAELVERLRGEHRVTVFGDSELTRIIGDERVNSVEIERGGALKPFRMAVGGVLMSAGVEPDAELFRGQLEADEGGYVRVTGERETSVENVFAVGDLANPLAQTVSTAVGDGATAAKVIAARLSRLRT
jgi:thioredoxin reductase (NADPH)